MMNNSNTECQPERAYQTVQPSLRSTLVSRNVTVARHRTSVRLEPEMWDALREICRRERANLHQICTTVSLQKTSQTSLTAAIRVYIMRYFRVASTEDGHIKAGHGYGYAMGMSANNTVRYTPPSPLMTLTKTSFA